MRFNDPDTYVNWYRVEEAGQNPRWESQCGQIEQISFGDDPLFQGFVAPEMNALSEPVSTLNNAKKFVEREYQKTHELVFAD